MQYRHTSIDIFYTSRRDGERPREDPGTSGMVQITQVRQGLTRYISVCTVGTNVFSNNGCAFNVDESCELWGHLDLRTQSRGEKDGASSMHVSILNTLISVGKTRRATMTLRRQL